MTIHVSNKGDKDANGNRVYTPYGDLCIPNWLWVAIKEEADELGVSRHKVVKDILKKHFAYKRRNELVRKTILGGV